MKSVELHCRVPAQMSENFSYFLWGSLCLATGALILHNLVALVRFDQDSSLRLKAWFHKKLGPSGLNRELWSAGRPGGSRSSRIVFRVVGVTALLMGLVLMGLAFRGHFH